MEPIVSLWMHVAIHANGKKKKKNNTVSKKKLSEGHKQSIQDKHSQNTIKD